MIGFPKMYISILFLTATLFFSGCTRGDEHSQRDDRISIVATTTMIKDLADSIGGDEADVYGLMGAGVDPHLYQASAGDVLLMQEADVVIYNGLHLEGKMGEVFESLGAQDKSTICIAEGISASSLIAWDEGTSVYDPHIWFDIENWRLAAKKLAEELTLCRPDKKDVFEANLENYLLQLDETEEYISLKAAELPEKARILVTAHDAFQYFSRAYGFKVYGIQGISTDSETGTADISALADLIAENRIKAIFVETSVPTKTVEALKAAVADRGFETEIGGSLYSDALGGASSGADSYISMMRTNIDIIVDALK